MVLESQISSMSIFLLEFYLASRTETKFCRSFANFVSNFLRIDKILQNYKKFCEILYREILYREILYSPYLQHLAFLILPLGDATFT
jgi:hypothetical protein